MNKKIIITAMVIISMIVISSIVIFKKNDEEESGQQGNQITKEEYNDNLMKNIEEEFLSRGIELRQDETTKFKGLQGNKYVVIEDGKETEKTFEIYPINVKEKTKIFRKNKENGKVVIDESNQGILKGNILIVNISDEELTNKIIELLEL